MLVPFILVSALQHSVVQAAAKIKDRRWSVLVCATIVTKKLVDMAITLYLINQPNILSADFRGFPDGCGAAHGCCRTSTAPMC
ncbi:MAG: hypothetical protein R2912_06690 [Eubacteriales bacterium]